MISVSPQQLVFFRENMGNSSQEMAELFNVSEDEWTSWEMGLTLPDYKKVGIMLLSMIFKGHIFIGNKSGAEIKHKLTKAKHVNEKLADSAVGADSTLHQYIDEELQQVIKLIK